MTTSCRECGCPLSTCPTCGATFPRLTARKVHCSQRCASTAHNRAVSAYRRQRRRTGQCKVCGSEFVTFQTQQKYCSATCKRKAAYLRYGRYKHCEKIAARTDLSDEAKAERIGRIIGPVSELSGDEIDRRAAEVRDKWNGAELRRRAIGPAPE